MQHIFRNIIMVCLWALPCCAAAQPSVIRIRKPPPKPAVKSDPRSLNYIRFGAGNVNLPHFILHTGAQYANHWLWEVGIRVETIQSSALVDAQLELNPRKEVSCLGVSYQRRITNSTARYISLFAGGGASSYLVPSGTGVEGTAFLTVRPARGFLRIFQMSYGYSIPLYKDFRGPSGELGINTPHKLSLTLNLLSF